MPEGEEDLSWSWIKESLPSLELGKQVLHQLLLLSTSSLSLLWNTQVFQLSMTLATHSLCTLSSLDTFTKELPEVLTAPFPPTLPPLPYSSPPQVQGGLQEDLAAISRLVQARGGQYDYLDPQNIACSIDI